MSQILLEQFSRAKAPLQGAQLSELVDKNRDWLDGSYYEGALARYGRGVVRAAAQVARISRHDLIEPYLIRVDAESTLGTGGKPVIGLGTSIRNQTIAHPDRAVKGTDVDYWLDAEYEDTHPAIHGFVGAAMLNRTVEHVLDVERPHDKLKVFATVEPGASHQPVGFAEVMEPVGDPSSLMVPGREDTFDITKGGRELQLYEYLRTFSIDPFARPGHD